MSDFKITKDKIPTIASELGVDQELVERKLLKCFVMFGCR
jgi:hypothetical protein